MLSFAERVRRYEKRVSRAKAREAEKRRQRVAWSKVRRVVYERDKGRCRATGKPLKFSAENPYEQAQVHHIQWRGRLGCDETSNLIVLDPVLHELVHGRMVNASRRIDVEGDGNGIVTVACGRVGGAPRCCCVACS